MEEFHLLKELFKHKRYPEESIEDKYPLMPLLFVLFLIMLASIAMISFYGEVEEEKHILFQIAFFFLLAVVGQWIAIHLRQPTVLVLLIIGILISDSFMAALFSFLPVTPPIIIKEKVLFDIFATFGLVVLMFRVGLHEHVKEVFSRTNFTVAFFGVLIPLLAGFGYTILFGGGTIYALFMGAVLAATSVGVTAAVLSELKVLNKKFSVVIIGAAVIDDILALILLTFLINLPGGLGASDIASLAITMASVIIFILGGGIAGKILIDYFMDRRPMGNQVFFMALFLVFLYSYIAEFLGLSAIVGAFFAGILLHYSRHKEKLEHRTYVLEAVFTPIFFLSLGLLVDVNVIAEYWIPILVLATIAILSKLIGCGIGALMRGLKPIESSIVGFGMTPRGEVTGILALFALGAGIFTQDDYSIITLMAILTMIITPLVLRTIIPKVKKQ